MEFRILSDLHLEIDGRESARGRPRFEIAVGPADKQRILILAGDIDTDLHACDFALRYQESFRAVVQVLGNHEYYKGGAPQRLPWKLKQRISEAGAKNVHLLENEAVDVDDVRFIGATLWTDFNQGDRAAVLEALAQMNDFRRIRTGTQAAPYRRRFSPAHARELHARSRSFLEAAIESAHRAGQIAVVVTHHAPYLTEGPGGSPLSFSYGSDLRGLIERSAPALWVHGHTHEVVDTRIHDTRIISNPRGYAGMEPVEGFRPNWVAALDNG